jgi:nicotinamide-nucleotide amidase
VGTAPGLLLPHEGRLVALLPGVPRELRALFPGVEAEVRNRYPDRLRPVHLRTVYTSGVPESVLAPQVDTALEGVHGVEVAFLPELTGVDIRLTVRGTDAERARQALDEAEARLGPLVEEHRIGGSGDVAQEVVGLLTGRGWTLALGESCTGGLAARRITDVPGASAVLLGGIVAYSNEAKVRHLGVDPSILESHGAVSRPVALAMAHGAARAFSATCGVGITGVAGPGGGSPDKPVGTVHVAAVVDGRAEARVWHFPEDREAVRIRSAQAALVLLLRLAGRAP